MLKKITQFTFLAALFFATAVISAESDGYVELSSAQPTQDPNKIEIIEFFWYGCPHCYNFEPVLSKWLETKPENVNFIRIPAIFSKVWQDHATAFYTAEALDVSAKVHADFFAAVQNNQKALRTEEQLLEFFTAHGVSAEDFKNAYNSFLVDTKVRQAKAMAPRYGVTGVPAIIINGKYKTNGPIAKSHEGMIEVMNRLIKQESGQ